MCKTMVFCCQCGEMFAKDSNRIKNKNFCCRYCLNKYNKEKMSFFNQTVNPMNIKGKMSFESREKRRDRMLKNENGTKYRHFMGDFEHRRIASLKLGRELKSNEVVHHIDGNKKNNKPGNLQVMTRAEHMSLHIREYWKKKKEGVNEA